MFDEAGHGQQAFEYRHQFVVPRRGEDARAGRSAEASQFVENLVEMIDDLHEAGAEGWQLVSVQVAEDDQGRYWLNACMKRPRPSGLQRAEQPKASAPLDYAKKKAA